MKLYRVSYSDGYTDRYTLIVAEAYPGDRKVVRIINMYRYCGKEMSTEDYKEFVLHWSDRIPETAIESVEEIPFIYIPERNQLTKEELQEVLNSLFVRGYQFYQKHFEFTNELTKKLCGLNNRSAENYVTH